MPLDPVDAIIAAFKTHDVIALGEGEHNNEQGHALRLPLIRDPRFPKVANDIVVEFGNSRYQDVMDRYAILHLGPQGSITYSTLTASQCADPEADADLAHEDQRGAECRFGRRRAAGVLREETRREMNAAAAC